MIQRHFPFGHDVPPAALLARAASASEQAKPQVEALQECETAPLVGLLPVRPVLPFRPRTDHQAPPNVAADRVLAPLPVPSSEPSPVPARPVRTFWTPPRTWAAFLGCLVPSYGALLWVALSAARVPLYEKPPAPSAALGSRTTPDESRAMPPANASGEAPRAPIPEVPAGVSASSAPLSLSALPARARAASPLPRPNVRLSFGDTRGSDLLTSAVLNGYGSTRSCVATAGTCAGHVPGTRARGLESWSMFQNRVRRA